MSRRFGPSDPGTTGGDIEDDRDRVALEDDELRHYLDDATVLLDDEEVMVERVKTADLQDFMLHRRFRYGHHPLRETER